MKLKLDLHPIYSDSRAIEESLLNVIHEAIEKRATEVEIIPGKGSGALKKTTLRFLDRPEIRALYHRVEKDGDNWGRLFVHFRFAREQAEKAQKAETPRISAPCFCCGETIEQRVDPELLRGSVSCECPACGSPNKVEWVKVSEGSLSAAASSGYE